MHIRHKLLAAFFLASFLVNLYATAAQASAPGPASGALGGQFPAARTTLVIFPDPSTKSMPDELWESLVSSLRQELISGEPKTRELDAPMPAKATDKDGQEVAAQRLMATDEPLQQEPSLQILRGDKIVPGIAVYKSITVYLIGECKVTPTVQIDVLHPVTISGALGWVPVTNGKIEPFIHIDCHRIGEILGQHALGLNSDQRQREMANAMARVILHEWIHIATQNPHHEKRGIAKAEFGISDLLEHPAKSSTRASSQSRIGD